MALLDVNVLVALAWDSHVHHVAARAWFAEARPFTWSTCSITEAGFIRVSSNPKVLPSPISVGDAVATLAAMRRAGQHRLLVDDVSPTGAGAVRAHRSRDVTDAHLLTLARRHGTRLVTFDADLHARSGGADVELLVL